MSTKYSSLPIRLTAAGTRLSNPQDGLPEHINMQNPALDAMTDLAHISPISVTPEMPINQAETQMKHGGVRLLFVVSESGEWLGLLTYTDLRGGRALKVQGEFGVSRGEVLVRDIMTPREQLEVMNFRDVLEARVGDIIETLMRTGRQHALVEEETPNGPAIRGIFSATRIGKQLGMPIESSGVAWTFAELEAALH